MTFSRVGERTVVRHAYSTSPLKLLNPQNHSAAAWVYLANYGGGLVGGDALRIDIDVERGAAAVISTQASTKVYRSPQGASQQLRAAVADDALLVLAPDPVVCFARSSYAQDVEIRLAQRGSLVLVDWLGAGRVASGERWQLDRFSSVTQIWIGKRRLLYDSLRLNPEDSDVAQRMGRFNTLLTVVVAGLADDAARILQEVGSMPLHKRADLLISANPLADGALLLRIAAVSTESAGQTLRRMLAFLPPKIGDDPWSRKW
ncbi:MAG TPA: urease accessory protein UreD [Thermoanaerobaculia bacterium]|nr:urease accessory protein UreD [Thermoanaerobaculia bacterium]